MGRHLRFLPGTVFQRELIRPVVKDARDDGIIVQPVTCSPTAGICLLYTSFRTVHEFLLVLTGESDQITLIVEEWIELVPTERGP